MSKCKECKHSEYGESIFYSICDNRESEHYDCMVYSYNVCGSLDSIFVDGCDLYDDGGDENGN
jgi:hypothetical protein